MSDTDSENKLLLDIIKIALTAMLATKGTAAVKNDQIARTEGERDICNGVVYTGQSPAYYEAHKAWLEQRGDGGTNGTEESHRP